MAAKIHVGYITTGGYILVPCASARTMRVNPTFRLPKDFDALPDEQKCTHCKREQERRAKKT